MSGTATHTGPANMVQAVQRALHDAMSDDDRIVVLGEDVATGGLFGACAGLVEAFGPDRVVETPSSEAGVVGTAIGMAVAGLRPVVELQLAEYVFPAFDQIASELAAIHARSAGAWSCPVVIRAPYGGSLSPEAHFCHVPGLRVAVAATPADAYTQIRAALRSDQPVLLLEPRALYRGDREDIGQETGAFDGARLVRGGADVSVFAWGTTVPVADEAASLAGEAGIEVEVVDLRTLAPLDVDSITASVSRTGRAVIVQEAPLTAGLGAEIAALIADHAVLSLEAPIRRVARENGQVPDAATVFATIEAVVDF